MRSFPAFLVILGFLFSRSGAADTDQALENLTIRDRPITVEVTLDKPTRDKVSLALAQTPPAPIRLTLKKIRLAGKAESVLGLRVFLNHPDANSSSSLKDTRYVGSIAFHPARMPEPQSFVLNVSETLAKLLSDKKLSLEKPLQITLVPTPEAGMKISKDLSLKVEKVALTVPSLDK